MDSEMIKGPERLGMIPAAGERTPISVQEFLRDDVFESSAESFPASDPPKITRSIPDTQITPLPEGEEKKADKPA